MNLPQVHAFPGRRSGSESCFLLLDPLAGCAADHPLHRSSLELQLDPAAIARVSRADLAHDPNACPILVRLASPGEAAPEALVQASAVCAVADAGFHKRYICGWLISALTCGELADHLASMCVFDEVPASRFLPIFEPIRLELLAAADSRFMSRRLGPIREWLLPASNGGVALLSGATDGARPSPTALALEAQQEAASVTSLLSAWRDALQSELPGALWAWQRDTVLPANAAAEAFRQIRQARALGLTEEADIHTLALHQLVLHKRLHEHPAVLDRIRSAGRGERTLSDYFTSISAAQWTQVVHALMDSRTTTS